MSHEKGTPGRCKAAGRFCIDVLRKFEELAPTMKSAIYLGPDANLAGYGHVKTGDVVELREVDADYIKRDGNTLWEFEEDAAGAKKKKPLPIRPGAQTYDLRRVPWAEPELGKKLQSFPMSELYKIADAMNHSKATVEYTKDTDRPTLVDAIITAAKKAAWIDEPETPQAPTDEPPAAGAGDETGKEEGGNGENQ
jgi:hypothetical protein